MSDKGSHLRVPQWVEAWLLMGLVICVGLAVSAICLAVMAKNAERNLEGMVEELTGKLRDSPELRGQPWLLDDIYSKLLDRYQKLGLYPDDDTHDRNLGVLYALVASTHRRQGGMKDARTDFETCLKIRTHLLHKHPEEPNYKSDLADVLDELAGIDMDEGHPDTARDRLTTSAKYRNEVQTNSNDPGRIVAYAATQLRLSEVLRRMGQTDQGQTEFQAALNVLKPRETDANAKYAQTLGVAKLLEGDNCRNDGNLSSAYTSYSDSCRIWDGLRQREPANVGYQVTYAVALACLGDAQKEMGEREMAKQSYLQSWGIRERLSKADETDRFRAAEYAVSLTTLGDIYHSNGDWDAAKKNYDQALELRKDLSKKAPGGSQSTRRCSRKLRRRG